MKKVLAMLACSVFVLGVGCGATSSLSSAVSSEASSVVVSSQPVSSAVSSAPESTPAPTGNTTVGSANFTLDDTKWVVASEVEGGVQYTNTTDPLATMGVIEQSVEGSTAVMRSVLLESELTQLQQEDNELGAKNVVIERGTLNGYDSATITFDMTMQSNGNSLDLQGAAFMVITEKTEFMVTLFAVDIAPHMADFNALVESLTVA